MALILTVKPDAASFEFFDALRRRHFPPERNFLAAHITLFHHLPDAEIERIEANLQAIAAHYQPLALTFPTLRFLGRGTAAEINSADLTKLRATLAAGWSEWLTAQDKQKFSPHITIQNKVAPAEARRLFEDLQASWQPKNGSAVGLQLWHYRGGPWEAAREFAFGESVER